MARQPKERQTRKTYVVLGDGQTEQYYLKHIKALKGYKYIVKPSLFTKISIETAGDIIDDYLSGGCDQIIYFTDYDTIVSQDKKKQFDSLVNKYKDRNEVIICESMPSIEFWFLLHFHKTTRNFLNSSEVFQELVKYITNFSKEKSFLENGKWVSELCKEGKLDDAINNASAILKQREAEGVGKYFPFTKAHLGIKEFEEQLK